MSNPSELPPKVVALLGPTASGKTALAGYLIQFFSLEVVSCDSVQIFKELNIGSAKPNAQELSMIKHHLLNVFSPDERPDAGKYKELAEQAILDITKTGNLPLIVGGTGMYFNALYFGMFEGNSRDERIRQQLETEAAQNGWESLHRELCEVDPQLGQKVMLKDHRRIIRGLEVYRKTGKSLSHWQQFNQKLDLEWLLIGLEWDRKVLYERIDSRVDRMLEEGLLEETQELIQRYGRQAYGLGSIGYRHCADYLDGKYDWEEMRNLMKQDTRHYAKRQLTWFRKNPAIIWISPEPKEEIRDLIARFLQF